MYVTYRVHWWGDIRTHAIKWKTISTIPNWNVSSRSVHTQTHTHRSTLNSRANNNNNGNNQIETWLSQWLQLCRSIVLQIIVLCLPSLSLNAQCCVCFFLVDSFESPPFSVAFSIHLSLSFSYYLRIARTTLDFDRSNCVVFLLCLYITRRRRRHNWRNRYTNHILVRDSSVFCAAE